MSYQLNAMIASEHRADLLRDANRYRLAIAEETAATPSAAREVAPPIVLRLAGERDAQALAYLAELDEAPVPSGQVLLALVGGHVISALSLEDGSVVANPFVRTVDAVSLLRVRADHLSGARRRRRWHAIPRLRLA